MPAQERLRRLPGRGPARFVELARLYGRGENHEEESSSKRVWAAESDSTT
jgi:hypothetical protein